jgi:phosphoenolpyruvate---glycerone phosphotransferase subunit DhaL
VTADGGPQTAVCGPPSAVRPQAMPSTPIDGPRLVQALIYVADVIESNKDYLCELDGEVGDGDHGVSMTIGWRMARKALRALADPTPESALRAVSEAYADEVGAASGVLYETAFEAAANAIAGRRALDVPADWAAVFGAIADEMQRIGKAQLGDKTLLDAWIPAADAMRAASGKPLAEAFFDAAAAAQRGVEQTRNLIPKRGRAARLGERARGFQDAGATSAYLIVRALGEGLMR